ncbi:uncharacterized protein [Magallana gigas]|uniref:uncharacterized protein n=1 Tax=Magallana gigas TaxID=29159 RepID=UPI0033408F69
MQFQFLKLIIVCILAMLQLSRNKQSGCSTFTIYEKFIGSLRKDRAKPLWEIEKESVGLAMHFCFSQCESDQRCVGIEICTIRPDLARCRGCCEWYVIAKDGDLPISATDDCKYFKLSKDSVESRGSRLTVNSKLSAVTSSTNIDEYGTTQLTSDDLDGVYGNDCYRNNVYSFVNEEIPWLEVTWSRTITIWRIIIYNRVDCCDYRLVNLNVTYKNNGVTGICGFYPGLLSHDGDIVLFYCPSEANATSVKLQIQSKSKEFFKQNFCAVEIYKKS